jgi:biopolymer transport protein ExbD
MSANVSGEGVNLSIIITPMLDMAFQLLAFFVMTYHPNALEGHINGKLLPPIKSAEPGTAAKKEIEPVPMPTEPDDPKETIYVVIKAVAKGKTEGFRSEGEPTRIQLKKPENAGVPDLISDTDTPFPQGLKKLQAELEKVARTPGGAKMNIAIEGDPDLRNEYVIRVYDVCKRAGFNNIGFVPPPLDVQGR